MKRMRLSFVVLFYTVFGFAAPQAPLLPLQFSGWTLTAAAQMSKDPGIADSQNAEVLKEYGFSEVTSGTYTRDDGRKLIIRAARFQDASGAYGAFTYYKTAEMQKEKIGDQAASFNERVLFYRGNTVVDARFEKVTAMSAAELRDLAAELPPAPANAAGLPGLPAYLPAKNYVKNSAKYIVGPAALEKSAAPVSAQLVDFPVGAEVVLADYSTTDNETGRARLALISYPTPQIAIEHLRRIDAARQQNVPSSGSDLTLAKRTGPIVAIVSGQISADDAKSILAGVNYEADVTWNKNTYFSRKDNPGNLLVNVIYLCAIIGGFCIVSGIAFGGVRLLAKRFFPDKLFDRPEMELISLHLSEEPAESAGR